METINLMDNRFEKIKETEKAILVEFLFVGTKYRFWIAKSLINKNFDIPVWVVKKNMN